MPGSGQCLAGGYRNCKWLRRDRSFILSWLNNHKPEFEELSNSRNNEKEILANMLSDLACYCSIEVLLILLRLRSLFWVTECSAPTVQVPSRWRTPHQAVCFVSRGSHRVPSCIVVVASEVPLRFFWFFRWAWFYNRGCSTGAFRWDDSFCLNSSFSTASKRWIHEYYGHVVLSWEASHPYSISSQFCFSCLSNKGVELPGSNTSA